MGNILQKGIFPFFVVHATAVVLKAVGDDEIVYMQQMVIDRNLIEHMLRDFHVCGLVFDNHLWLHGPII